MIIVLWTDALVYLLVAAIIGFVLWVRHHEHLRTPWRQVARRRLGMIALVVLLAYVAVGLLDSVHYRPALAPSTNGKVYYSTRVYSLLDRLVRPLGQRTERSYSAPFALTAHSKGIVKVNGVEHRDYPRLRYGGVHLPSIHEQILDIATRCAVGVLKAIFVWLLLLGGLAVWMGWRSHQRPWCWMKGVMRGGSPVAWRELLITLFVVLVVACIAMQLADVCHIFGSDKVGKDVFYETIKSIRTGLLIGTLTTLFMLPFALFFGPMAGFFSGWVDDVIQYVYTTLSSIPAVLLISAAILSLQVFVANHPNFFPTLEERADVRLLALCVILGVTSWTSLCRLLRAETLKLREIDFVRASQALGVGRLRIIARHILPNVMHIVLITVVLDFSALVLAEAVLSYVGVGVDPTTMSWGNMINSARLELARDPIVWWPLLAAFVFMFGLVLSANLFADSVRDAFDPRLREE